MLTIIALILLSLVDAHWSVYVLVILFAILQSFAIRRSEKERFDELRALLNRLLINRH